MRRLGLVLVLLMAVPALAGARAADGPARAAEAPALTLKAATTASKIKPFGTASPRRAGHKVRLKLFVDAGEGYERAATDRVKVRSDGTYVGAFERPAEGSCKVRAAYASGDQEVQRDRVLPCYRPVFGTGTATLTGAEVVTIDVEIASNGEQRSYGLMYRKWLHPDKGMVFQFPSDSQGGFWMKNTLIPLSIAFYDAGGTIVDILDMEPCEADPCTVYSPDAPYRGALEVNQGAFAAWGIEVGDTITVD